MENLLTPNVNTTIHSNFMNYLKNYLETCNIDSKPKNLSFASFCNTQKIRRILANTIMCRHLLGLLKQIRDDPNQIIIDSTGYSIQVLINGEKMEDNKICHLPNCIHCHDFTKLRVLNEFVLSDDISVSYPKTFTKDGNDFFKMFYDLKQIRLYLYDNITIRKPKSKRPGTEITINVNDDRFIQTTKNNIQNIQNEVDNLFDTFSDCHEKMLTLTKKEYMLDDFLTEISK